MGVRIEQVTESVSAQSTVPEQRLPHALDRDCHGIHRGQGLQPAGAATSSGK